jgi:methanogenic corrinoid protein MtbC1
MACDLLEADGYEVRFAGGGIANDEVVAELGELDADVLVVFGAVPTTVPFTRQLIDRLHEIGCCPKLQIVVGGGVFNRAEGLAEEIGADLWASTPDELVEVMADEPERRMTQDQRTVGRKRRPRRNPDADADAA